MKILFLAHRSPYPANKGDKIRSYNTLLYLAERHDVFLAFPDDEQVAPKHDPHLYEITHQVISRPLHLLQRATGILKSFLTGKPLSVGHFYSARLHRDIKALAEKEKFDALFAFSSTMAEYAKGLNIPVRIIDFCDLDSAKFEQFAQLKSPPLSWIYKMEARRLKDYERRVGNDFQHILFIGPEEQHLFSAPRPVAQKVKIMSNGVEIPARSDLEAAARENTALQPNIVFTGVMDYLPNVDAVAWFARRVFPRLVQAMPDVHFYIVGKDPDKNVRALHDPAAHVHVTGAVASVAPYLESSLLFAAPMRIARGMQTKILQAMAYNVPVICSAQAARALGAVPGEHLLTAETADEYMQKSLALVGDPSRRHSLQQAALGFLQQKFTWQKNLALSAGLLMQQKASARRISIEQHVSIN